MIATFQLKINCYKIKLPNKYINHTSILMLCLEWIVDDVREWKCEESLMCLDCGNLEWMSEKSLLKNVSDVIVLRVFWIIFKSINCMFTNLPLFLKIFE